MKPSILFLLFVTMATGGLAVPVRAQTSNFQHAEAGRYDVSLAFGLDPAVVTSVGITRWTGVGDRVVGLSLEGTLPVADLDVHDYRVGAGASMSLVRFGTFLLATRLGLSARGTQNVHFTAHGFGADLAAFFGHYGQRTFAAVELGYDKAVLEHIEHRPFYLANYPDAVDGWYKAPAGTFRFGLTTGVSRGRMSLGLRAYIVRSEGWEELMPPLGTTMSLSCSF
ncbi:MAG: hypothetical protein HKO65_19830 [Gemmatimonadetes bacterium]|nr:hypothetical protein [Gemmatimonadota bacterium]NNM07354.1 hypothetical protein [Gemmatimonadota bacterium]